MEPDVQEQKPKRIRKPKASPGEMCAREVNALPLSEYPAYVAALTPIVQSQIKALLNQVKP